jgi:PhnB protein
MPPSAMSSEDPMFNPYLTFDGNAGEAMRFYHSILGGELTMQTFGEVKMAKTAAEKDRIVHATLKNKAITFMASDGMVGRPIKVGDNVSMSIGGSDHRWLSGVFEKLAQGGRVDMPLAKQFWGDTYGQLTDRFGIHWMVNITAPQPST